ncbi:MAG TPA: SRPBCC domain-containing protein [Cyclobacteriaceae bacterium]|nr:SRPBCC domain-containing protein [Cyclobacteriaceae bacterium]
MKAQDFTTTITVKQSPGNVFDAIMNVRGWWSENVKGNADKLNDVFIHHYQDVHYCKIQLTDVTPGKRVEWTVLDNHFSFTADKTEWIGTKAIFDISKKGDKTQLKFTHRGLVPAYECFDMCSDAWTTYIHESLKDLIETGKGQPNPVEGGYNAELLEKWAAKK